MAVSENVYRGYTFENEFGNVKYVFFRPDNEDAEIDATIKFWASKGWEVKDLYKNENLGVFLLYWFRVISKLSTDKDSVFCCGKVRYWGIVCKELMDFMGDEDLDWSDLGIDGELFIHLSIIADNHKYCILMEE